MATDAALRESLITSARDLISTCEGELAVTDDPPRMARLHHEMALTYEASLDDAEHAVHHYRQALDHAPDHLPAIRGARRLLSRLGDYSAALPLFDAEARLIADPKRKAMLYYDKGYLLESLVGDREAALSAYRSARDLDRNNPSILKSLERHHAAGDDRAALARLYQDLPNAITSDGPLRAALLVRRARSLDLAETREKIELYESALANDPNALGALESLKRLYHQTGRWPELITALEREAALTCDDSLRAAALYRVAVVHADRLGNRAEALAALERAIEVAPKDRLILEDIARLYAVTEDHEPLARVLAAIVETAAESSERVALLHQLGQLYDTHLGNQDRAIRCYRAALKFEPTYVPGLQALGKLYRANEDWVALIQMHLAEAEAAGDPSRRAAAHARVAEIFEVRLQRPVDAAEHHARALALVPGYPASFKALTRLYHQAGSFRELIELYERAIDESSTLPLKVAYLFKIGSLWEDSQGDPVQAGHAYSRILALDPDNLGAIHAIQRVTERAGRYQELVEALELEARKAEEPDRILGLLHRAGTVLDDQIGDRDGALVRFRKVLELDPTFVPALASLGRIYYRAGRWDDLLEMYGRELEVTPEGPGAVALLYRMGELCEGRLGRDHDAIDHYRRAAVLDPTHRPALRALARKLEEHEQWAQLPDVYELDLSGLRDPAARAAVLYRLGAVREDRLGDPAEALAAYQRALAEVATYRPAIDAVARLRTERKGWEQLVGDLARDEHHTEDPLRRAAAVMRQAELQRDHLDQSDQAITSLERLLESDQGRLPALLALEPLYSAAERWQDLADTYRHQAELITDPAARVAALRELARLQATRQIGEPADLIATYDAILDAAPDDQTALRALARIGHVAGNRVLLTRVEARLGASADDPGIAAHHFTRLAHTLEGVDENIAIDAYRGALAKDPDSLTAIRGLARLAERNHDDATLVDALHREATLTRRAEAAADLYTRSAGLRRDRLDDEAGALVDLERALELGPDRVDTAEQLTELLATRGRYDRLVDLLARAAGSARAPARKATLWETVAGLYSEQLDNRGAAAAALSRALQAVPDHIPTMRRLARLQAANRQWSAAVELLDRVLEITEDPAIRCETHLALAAMFDEQLVAPERAITHIEAVLEIDATQTEALLRLIEIHRKRSDIQLAIQTARQLVEVSRGTAGYEAGLLRLARLEREHGDPESALSALLDAVIVEGPSRAAAAELRDMIEDGHGDWAMYADALSGFLESGDPSAEMLEAAYLELAAIQADRLDAVDAAVATLEAGVARAGARPALVDAMSTRLRQGGQSDQALEHARKMLADDASRPDTWRVLYRALAQGEDADRAWRALAPIAVLGEATGDEADELEAHGPAHGHARRGSLDTNALRTIAVEGSLSSPATDLLGVLTAALARLHPAKLDGLGLSKRDRIPARSSHAMRPLVDELAAIFAVEEFDLYEHMLPHPLVSVETTDPPAIVIAEALATRTEASQVFLLGHAMAMLATRTFPVAKLTPDGVERLLTAAARSVVSSFSGQLAGDRDLDDYAQQVHKAVARKLRKQKEDIARRYIADPDTDVAGWIGAVHQTAIRAAVLLSNDLATGVDMLADLDPGLARLTGAERVRRSPAIADLLRFWVSDKARAFRRRAGIG